MGEYLIELKNINKSFGSHEVLKNINLGIKKNEFLTLLGPSGCGKTTILRIIGGFERPDSGVLMFDGRDIINVPPHIRRVNTVFQNYALFPHMNVAENIAFGLKIKKVDKSTISEKVRAMLKLVNLEGYERRSVVKLSGGQQQRIAIARALVNEPDVLLLDEPLGALDLKLRKEMQIELKNMQQKIGITFVSVTHDQEEALTMSDTVAVMKDGELLQLGTPKDIYDEPANAFVADFIGESNLVDGVMIADYRVRFCGVEFRCVDSGFDPDEPVDVAVRPEDIDIYPQGSGQITGIVKTLIFRGMLYEIQILSNNYLWRVHTTDPWEVGTTVGIGIDEDLMHVMRKSEYAPYNKELSENYSFVTG